MRSHGRGAVGGAAEMGFCGDVVEVWFIGAVFGGCRGGVGVIEHVKGRFHTGRGIHEAFIVAREGQLRNGRCEGKGRKKG